MMHEKRSRFRSIRPLLGRAAAAPRLLSEINPEGKLLMFIKAAKPTRKKKRLLFICVHGIGSSNIVRAFFQAKALENPLNANLVVHSAGLSNYSPSELALLVNEFDFIVPLTNGIANHVAKAIEETEHKPTVINPNSNELSFLEKSINDYAKDKADFVINTIRASLEKEEKGK